MQEFFIFIKQPPDGLNHSDMWFVDLCEDAVLHDAKLSLQVQVFYMFIERTPKTTGLDDNQPLEEFLWVCSGHHGSCYSQTNTVTHKVFFFFF